MCALSAYPLACGIPFRLQSSHSQAYFFCRAPMWSLWMCSTRASISPRSPTGHPSHLHTVTCSWPRASSSWSGGSPLVGEPGTSPEVSEEMSVWSSMWDSGVLRCEKGPIRWRLAGGMMGASGRQSVLWSRSSVLTSSAKSSDEREESGEPGESAIVRELE